MSKIHSLYLCCITTSWKYFAPLKHWYQQTNTPKCWHLNKIIISTQSYFSNFYSRQRSVCFEATTFICFNSETLETFRHEHLSIFKYAVKEWYMMHTYLLRWLRHQWQLHALFVFMFTVFWCFKWVNWKFMNNFITGITLR